MSDAMKREIPDRQKTFERTFTDVDLLLSKSGKFQILQEGCATNVRVGDFYLKSLTLMLYTYLVCMVIDV